MAGYRRSTGKSWQGYEVHEQNCRGTLKHDPTSLLGSGIVFDIDGDNAPYDAYLRDRIASVEYGDIETAIREFGEDKIAAVLDGRTWATLSWVSYMV